MLERQFHTQVRASDRREALWTAGEIADLAIHAVDTVSRHCRDFLTQQGLQSVMLRVEAEYRMNEICEDVQATEPNQESACIS